MAGVSRHSLIQNDCVFRLCNIPITSTAKENRYGIAVYYVGVLLLTGLHESPH